MPIFTPQKDVFSGQLAAGDANGFNPSTNSTYFIGVLFGVDPGTGDGADGGYWVDRDSLLVSAYAHFAIVGTAGSTENCTLIIRKNATTDILTIASTLQLTSTNGVNVKSTGNAIVLSADDHVVMKLVTPATWVTKPTVVFPSVTLVFEGLPK